MLIPFCMLYGKKCTNETPVKTFTHILPMCTFALVANQVHARTWPNSRVRVNFVVSMRFGMIIVLTSTTTPNTRFGSVRGDNKRRPSCDHRSINRKSVHIFACAQLCVNTHTHTVEAYALCAFMNMFLLLQLCAVALRPMSVCVYVSQYISTKHSLY